MSVAQFQRGSKPPLLVELIVIGQKRLGHDTEHVTLLDNYGTVEQHSASLQRHADNGDDVKVAAEIHKRVQGFLGSVEQQTAAEEVLAGVTRKAKFREAHNLHSPILCLCYQTLRFSKVIRHVGHPYTGHCRRHIDKSVFHVHRYFIVTWVAP